jgi:hypothetical protein
MTISALKLSAQTQEESLTSLKNQNLKCESASKECHKLLLNISENRDQLAKEKELLMLRDYYHTKQKERDAKEMQEMRNYIDKQSREGAGRKVALGATCFLIGVGISILTVWVYSQMRVKKIEEVRVIR